MHVARPLNIRWRRLWLGGWVAMLLTRMRYELRGIVGSYPSVFLPFKRWKRKRRRRGTAGIVDASTEIVIEGFPRSGNTFAEVAFTFAQQRQVDVAHHLHVPAQVIYAVRRRIPTLVIVRRPKDAAVALKLMDPKLNLRQILKGYVRFHQSILPYLDGCVVATFDQVTSDLGAVIARLNRRYGTDFKEFVHTDENVARVFAILRTIAYSKDPDRTFFGTIPDRPSEREEERQMLKEQFDSLQARRDFQLAHQLYERFSSNAAS